MNILIPNEAIGRGSDPSGQWAVHELEIFRQVTGMKPKELARQNIDKLLEPAGWSVHGYKDLNLSASPLLGSPSESFRRNRGLRGSWECGCAKILETKAY
jgi:hypothetical protein